jgi:ubiquinone/menaquinone biosynthesis C-methylase UbiE
MPPIAMPDLVRLYDTSARYWDSRIHRGVYRRSYIRLFERLEAQGRLGQRGKPLRVLDCGTGAALLLTSLVSALARPCHLYGIDMFTKMLEFGRTRLRNTGSRATLIIGDVLSLPFRDGSMDVVMAALLLEHIPRPADALREMSRVAG